MGRIQALLWGNEKPLFDHFRQLGECIGRAGEEFLALARDFEHSKIHADKLHEIEHECDAVKEILRNLLDENTFLPIEHDDIKELIGYCDDIVDLIWGAANRIANKYDLKDPDLELTEIATILSDMTKKTNGLLLDLQHIKQKKNRKNLQDTIACFRQQERRTDELRDEISKRRHKTAKENPLTTLPAVLCSEWDEVIQHLEHATDECVHVTNILSHFPRKYG